MDLNLKNTWDCVIFLNFGFFLYQESGNNELAKSLLNELKIVYFFSALRFKMGIK